MNEIMIIIIIIIIMKNKCNEIMIIMKINEIIIMNNK